MATDKNQAAPSAEIAAPSVHDQLVSSRIRQRIKAAGVRFHANDNIAAFIKEGELEQLQAEVQSKLAAVLESLVIDVESDHNTQDTAKRVAKMYSTKSSRAATRPRRR
jgi:GTP cyclohydrolase I